METVTITKEITPRQFRKLAERFGDPYTAPFEIDRDGIVTYAIWHDYEVQVWTIYGDGETVCESRGLDIDGWQEQEPATH